MKHIVFDCDGTLIDTSGPRYQLFDGIKDLLVELSRENLLYVWTVRGRASTLKLLQEFGIMRYFETISTVDDAFPKPHIAGLLDLVGPAAKHAVCVIGDSSNDMLGAKNFGVLAIGATWNPEAKARALKEGGADFIVSHPSECSKLIQLNLMGATGSGE